MYNGPCAIYSGIVSGKLAKLFKNCSDELLFQEFRVVLWLDTICFAHKVMETCGFSVQFLSLSESWESKEMSSVLVY